MISSDVVSSRRLAYEADRPRVLHVHAGNLYGGLETFLRTIGRQRIDALPATMDYALCFDGRIARELRDVGATVHMLGAVRLRSPRRIAAVRRELARIIREDRYDVVVCHSAWTHSLFAPVVRERGARLVCYLHDVPDPKGWLDRLASLTTPDLVLCNSSFTEGAAAWLFPKTRRRTLLLPVAVDERTSASRSSVRAELGAGDTVVILQASRMQSWKGHELLLQALSLIRDDPRWTCWIAGGAQRASELSYERGLVASVTRLGLESRIKFLGQRDDVGAVMRAADVYCQPNIRPEPFGVAFVEALAAGLPVVTTSLGGALEIVSPECGRLTPPRPGALAAALSEYIDSDRKRREARQAGPVRARQLCDVTSRTYELARELAMLANPRPPIDVGARAALSGGRSGDVILSVVAAALREKGRRFDTIVDLGCGQGRCARSLEGMFDRYVGCDVVRYDGFPRAESVHFRTVDLNKPPYPLEGASASVVIAIETIEHVENPRALVREMARVVRPGGWIVVTTPNQLSLASKSYLVLRNEFQAFREAPGLYPAHITALVEEDLTRIARECGLVEVGVRYTDRGRIPFTAKHWPALLGARGRWFSDNVVMLARRP
jgi:glycosyltransferase involved in cell wall biosynthesis/2-polyprenyl-3-methyl-5-hydroxy-6-metoxy-1,4-benzoquinol methylase